MKGLLIKVHLFFGYSYSLIPKELRSQVAKGEGTGNIVARVPQNQHFQPFCDPIFKLSRYLLYSLAMCDFLKTAKF